jgi:translation initiation factor 2B subunit (eIF-2B alpha/beta/delta family)
MHPIERLRDVARASGADAGLLVQDAAQALMVFHNDPAGMVTAARRLLTRQPAIGPLWWMCSRLTTTNDVWAEVQLLVDEVSRDRTSRELAHNIPDGATVVICGCPRAIVEALPRRGDVRVLAVDVRGQGSSVVRRLDRAEVEAIEVDPAQVGGAVEAADLVIIEAMASGSAASLGDVGCLPLAATARALATPIWLVAGVGRRVPEPYWQAIVERTVAREAMPWAAPFEVVAHGLVDRIVTEDGLHLTAEVPPAPGPMAAELLRELT